MQRILLPIACIMLILGTCYMAEANFVDTPNLQVVEYGFYASTGYELSLWPIVTGDLNVRIENHGGGDALNVIGQLTSWPLGITVPDADVSVGDLPAGGSGWSADSFSISLDMTMSPLLGPVFWRLEYDDFLGNHHVVEGVPGPDFPPVPTETPVPEPGTLLLISTGLAGLAGYGIRLRRRKKA